jgi:hypothetical protein
VPWLRRFVASLSPRRPGSGLRLVHLRYVVGKVALGQGFLPSVSFSPVSIIQPLLHTHLCLHVARTKYIKELLPTSSVLSGKRGTLSKKYFHFLYVLLHVLWGGFSLFTLGPIPTCSHRLFARMIEKVAGKLDQAATLMIYLGSAWFIASSGHFCGLPQSF